MKQKQLIVVLVSMATAVLLSFNYPWFYDILLKSDYTSGAIAGVRLETFLAFAGVIGLVWARFSSRTRANYADNNESSRMKSSHKIFLICSILLIVFLFVVFMSMFESSLTNIFSTWSNGKNIELTLYYSIPNMPTLCQASGVTNLILIFSEFLLVSLFMIIVVKKEK